MNFFSIRTNDQKTIGTILNKEENVVFDRLSWHKNEISIGDIVFVVISGDDSKKTHNYQNGLASIGIVSNLPEDESDKTHFKLRVKLTDYLPRTLSKNDFYYYPSLKNAPNIGPDTKSAPNQAFRKMESVTGKNVIRAVLDILPNSLNKTQYATLIGSDFEIQKLSIDKNIQNQLIIDFIKWFEKPENFKRSYDGLVSYEILDFWNRAYFKNELFPIKTPNTEIEVLQIQKLVLNRSNEAWNKFSSATSKGAPLAIIGKNNYLAFLQELLGITLPNESNIATAENFNYQKFVAETDLINLTFSKRLCARLISSLTTKPFVILTGLTGSGKTKLAQSFAQWICGSEDQYKIVPVGADWTNREPLLGYPSGIESTKYIAPDSGVLDLMLQAKTNDLLPHFLILDEMNLSHVERYFADFLSVMESNDTIKLYSGDEKGDIPNLLSWPSNLFIIGTVNIDESTYMFSPKVLDRANVIEFRVTEQEMGHYLENNRKIDLDQLNGKGASMALSFLELSKKTSGVQLDVAQKGVLLAFFKSLKKLGAEFGYRSAGEMITLITQLGNIESGITDNEKLDIAIIQKLLPKLHGSRSKLLPVLEELGKLCLEEGIDLKKEYLDKMDSIDVALDPNIKFKLSFDKIIRMYKNALSNGFTSFAEA